MNARNLLHAARRRTLLIALFGGLPLALAVGLLATRVLGFDTGYIAGTLALLAVSGIAVWRARCLDARWLVARLNDHPRFEDSADLLFAATPTLNPLQQRQRVRRIGEDAERLSAEHRRGRLRLLDRQDLRDPLHRRIQINRQLQL